MSAIVPVINGLVATAQLVVNQKGYIQKQPFRTRSSVLVQAGPLLREGQQEDEDSPVRQRNSARRRSRSASRIQGRRLAAGIVPRVGALVDGSSRQRLGDCAESQKGD